MRALFACALVLFAASLAAAVDPARACSCIPPDPWTALAQADGVFVGTVVERRDAGGEVLLVMSVDRRLKGPLGRSVEVRTAQNGSVCGVEADVGQRVGLALYRDGGAWRGNLCWQFEPAQLLVVAALPPPTGRGPAALFVGGRFGPARTLALDARGRTLAYGIGAGRAEGFSRCPGGDRVAELVTIDGAHVVAVRELPSLRRLWQRRLRSSSVATLHCVDAVGEQLGVFASNESAEGRLLRVTPRRVTTLWRGFAFYAAFKRRAAYIQVLRRGTTILAIDLRTGRAANLGSVPVPGVAHQLVFNPAGNRLAGESFTEGVGNPRLVVVDLARQPISVRTIPLPTVFGAARWLGNDRLAYFGGRGEILVYGAKLGLKSRARGWRAGAPAIVGRTAFGIRGGTLLVAAKLPRGPQRVVRRLPGEYDRHELRVIVAATG